jgi:hypothetical protein
VVKGYFGEEPLRVEYINGKRWKILEPFSFLRVAGGEKITVPADFVTDFASIPRALWSIYPPAGKWGRAAVIHDYLYAVGDRPRIECDQVFLEAMEVLGVPWVRRHLLYRAVRVGGGKPWKAHRIAQTKALLILAEKAERRKHEERSLQ